MPARPCCQLNELLGVFYATRGRIISNGPGQAAYFSLLRNTVARKVVRLGRLVGHLEAKYHAVRTAKRTAFFIELPLPAGMPALFARPAAQSLPDRPCDRKALLRGFFLGCGSVNAPSARYHLEFVTPTFGWATGLVYVLHDLGVRSGISERGGQHVVYLKEGDAIARCLQLMGGSRAVMEFEKFRVVREVSGQVNRRLNFETANLDKTIGSSLRQVAAIDKLDREGRLRVLPPALRDMARWRREYPDLNLSELAERMDVSKSAINHRLRRLLEVADGVAAAP